MTKLSSGFQYLIKKFGPPQNGEPVPKEVREAYASRVPQTMLDFWEEYGTGLWLDGYFQLCRPDQYQSLVDFILQGDPDFPPEKSVLIGFSAFGTLLIWNNKNYFLKISLYNKIAYSFHLSPDFPILPPDKDISAVLISIDSEVFDYLERTKEAKPLFKRALKKLGPLAYGECYGFIPALELGGREVLEEVHKRPARPYFQMVADLDPIALRYNDLENHQVRFVRYLGEPAA
ncbi:GAD-like domain-containing protein [Swingsia samuiensis]|uniref:DUF1851 domain-containing protein n=1 Tax=Swingsia samuiensis TaxID=1293412 RepID=A0A4Y6UMV7_9PROT|nr:GAD-like domain-containing protein [Swingsia samuiensis]QDH18100.1 DUF1851 domain-containing protein [Swingsia samuiensis]